MLFIDLCILTLYFLLGVGMILFLMFSKKQKKGTKVFLTVMVIQFLIILSFYFGGKNTVGDLKNFKKLLAGNYWVLPEKEITDKGIRVLSNQKGDLITVYYFPKDLSVNKTEKFTVLENGEIK